MGEEFKVQFVGKETVRIFIQTEGHAQNCLLLNVLYVPSLKCSLIFVGACVKRNSDVSFDRTGVNSTKI